MRLRNVKNAYEQLHAHPEWIVLNPRAEKGHWSQVFGNDHPIRLEIGCGKGKFLIDMAELFPQYNYIGIEKFDSVLVRALQRVLKDPRSNLRLIRADAVDLTDLFSYGEIAEIYLNFSDPWPKPAHAKRRLTSPQFLERYLQILPIGRPIYFKTDNFPLFLSSMMSIVDAGMSIGRISLDLHQEIGFPNVETEFETKFVAMGKPIYYLHATFKG